MFKLCLAIGGDRCIHPDVLSQYLNRRQILEWGAFGKLFPFGSEVEEYGRANATFWTRAAWLGEHETGEPKDYMAKWNNEPPKTEAQIIADQILESL